MTDINAGTNMPEIERLGVPSELIGNPRPASIEAKRTSYLSPSENSTYIGGDTVRFTLPCQPNTYLTPDVSLEFVWKNTTAAAAAPAGGSGALDYSASSIIRRLRIFHGSQLLEDVSEYGKLRQIIQDISQSPVNSSTISSILEGTPPSGAVAGGGVVATREDPSIPNLRSLKIVPEQMRSTFVAPQQSRRYKIRLVSGLIGSLATASCPCNAMSASPLRVEIELASNNDAVLSMPATVAPDPVLAALPITWEINNVQLNATYIQVSSAAQALIDQATGGKYMLNTSMYRHAQQNLPGSSQSGSILLPFSYSSLKHVLHGHYIQSNNNNQTTYSISGRSRCNIGKTWYQIGASRVPSQQIDGSLQILSEACSCFAISSDLLQVSNHLTLENTASPAANFCRGWYKQSVTAVAGGAAQVPVPAQVPNSNIRGTFTSGYDMEAFGAASSTQRIESGINTTALQMYYQLETVAGQTFGGPVVGGVQQQVEVHSWAQYDCLITCANGQAYARF